MRKFYILFLITLFIRCNKPEKESQLIFDTFPVIEIVNGENITSNQILNPQELIIIDDYLIVLNNKEDSIFCVFSLNDFNLIKTFGKRGKGPNEYIYPHLFLSDPKESNFYLRDLGKRKVEIINVDNVVENQGDYVSKSIPWNSPRIPLNAIINNHNIIFDSFTPNNGAIYVSNFNQEEESAIYDFSDMKDKYKNSTVYKGYLIAGENRIAYAYQFFKRIDILNDKGNLLSSSIALEKHKPIFNTEGLINRRKSTIYYIGAFAGNEYIYFLSFGKTGNYYEENILNVVSSIEVFNWEGVPIKKIVLDRYISNFTVDERRNLIIGVDPRNEQPLFKFDISTIY